MSMMAYSGFIQSIHPLTFYAVQKLAIILLVGFTPSRSLLRYAPLPVLLGIGFSILPCYGLHIGSSPNILWAAGEVLMGNLEYIEKLLLSQWSFEDKGPRPEIRRRENSKSKSEGSSLSNGKTVDGRFHDKEARHVAYSFDNFYDRVKFALWAGTSYRYIATPFQTANTPPYSTSNPTYIPSRTVFLLRKGLIIISSVVVLDLIALSKIVPRDLALFTEEKARLFPPVNEITATWVLTRVRSTFGFWLGNCVGMQIYYSAITSIGVAIGLTNPAERRPVFGSIADAYNLRGYWG